MTALAGSIGTGNIVGVATAVASGGPGAVFWIWCYGFVATAIKFTEAVLGIRFRVLTASASRPAPCTTCGTASKAPWLLDLRAGGRRGRPHHHALHPAQLHGGRAPQPALDPHLDLGSGHRRAGLARDRRRREVHRPGGGEVVAAQGVPLPAGGIIVIGAHVQVLPGVMAQIFREAFSARGAIGGTAGVGMMVAMRYGLARGIYANEAGYGTAAVVYGTARSERPVQQGLNAVMEVFIVSFVTSSISALTILVSGAWRSAEKGAPAVAQAFGSVCRAGAATWLPSVCSSSATPR